MTRRKKDGRESHGPSEAGEAFEDQLRKLELLVERMEGEDLKLEDAIGLFEEGMNLSKGLLDRLEKAEKRVEILVRKGRAEVEKRSLDTGRILSGGDIGEKDSDEEEDDELGEEDL